MKATFKAHISIYPPHFRSKSSTNISDRRNMTKKELAKHYEIHLSTLGRYLNSGQLYQKLLPTGYQVRQKRLTPRQISIILEHLGEF
jgi:transposase